MGILSLAVLGAAVMLTPDPRGFGTHEQLGLPQCSFLEYTGLKCPHCGMTTSLSYVVRGQWYAALRANPSGLILAAVLSAASPWCLAVAVAGRWLGVDSPAPWLIYGTLSFLVITCVFWIMQMTA